ncbi:MAG: hypothetical protein U1E45_20410 [Geminicoccaceae bacterium]
MATARTNLGAAGAVHDTDTTGRLIDFRRVSWGSILAGAAVALATQALLTMLGAGIGLGVVEPSVPGASPEASTIGISAAIWWAISGIISAFVGGWIAARLAATPAPMSGALHGLATWAITTLVILWLAGSSVASAVSGAGAMASRTLGGLGNAASGAVSTVAENVSDPFSRIADEVRAAAQPNDPEAARQELVNAVRRVVSGDQGAVDQARQTAVDLMVRQGVPQQEAQQRVQQWEQQVTQARDQAAAQARQAADAAADAASTGAFYGFIALLLGAIAAFFGGRTGAQSLESLTPAGRAAP